VNRESEPSAGLACLVDARPGCAWSNHGFKHFGAKGVTAAHTRRPNPARYSPELDAEAVQELELRTVRAPDARTGELPARTCYLRGLGERIGWDDGEPAMLSYVECAGGLPGPREYHGRPMHDGNRKARKMRTR
jgi:hypothetical protein